MGDALRSAVCVGLLPPLLILYSAGAAFVALLGLPRERIDWFYFAFSRLCISLAGTRLEVAGRHHIKPGHAYVVVPNHESNWDPMCVLLAVEPLPVRFVVKRQIMAIPVFGQALRMTGNVRVERSNTTGDVERIRRKMAERPLEVSMLFYAEGTRSRDGALHEFKKGAFTSAITYGLEILPIGHAGCFRIWAPESARLRKGGVQVEIGEPIPVAGLGLEDRAELLEQTREAVSGLRARARAKLRERGWDPGGID